MIVSIAKQLIFEDKDSGSITRFPAHIQISQRGVDIMPYLTKIGCPQLLQIQVLINCSISFEKLENKVQEGCYYIDGKYFELEYTFFLYKTKKQKIEKNSQFLQKEMKKIKKIKKIIKSQLPKKEEKRKVKQQRLSRCKERTIIEVIKIVKKWRDTHVGANKIGMQKVSLKEAADKVGVSKKTLDDYYYQLRIGELKQFDFANNLHNKIGVLRNYIKDYERGDKNTEYHKHPKKLEVLDGFQEQIQKDQQNALKQGAASTAEDYENEQDFFEDKMDLQNVIDLYQSREQMIKAFEDEFFGNFEIGLQDPNDPFLTFEKILYQAQTNKDPLFDLLQ